MKTRSLGQAVALAVTMLSACLASTGAGSAPQCVEPNALSGERLLVFSRTAGFRHASIAQGVTALEAIGAKLGMTVTHTEAAEIFTSQDLSQFSVIVFLSTSGDVLDQAQETAFEAYIRGGGGFVGIHSATDTEYEWSWYGQLIGTYFKTHPAIQQATVQVTDATHPATRCLPSAWVRTDEWYDFRDRPPGVSTIAIVDENTYQGGTMGAPHPITWSHDFDGGRAWYTAMGHTAESYLDPLFREHLAGGILWAAGP